MTVNGAVNLLVENTLFNGTGSGGVGTSPMEGVDVEPSFREQVRNVVFSDCRAVGNTGAGFAVYLAEYNVSHGPVTLTFCACPLAMLQCLPTLQHCKLECLPTGVLAHLHSLCC